MRRPKEQYLNNRLDQVASQKRRDRDVDLKGVATFAGGLAAFALLAKKISLTRGFSAAHSNLSKKALKQLPNVTKSLVTRTTIKRGPLKNVPIVRNIPKWIEEIMKPIPSALTQARGAMSILAKENPSFSYTMPIGEGFNKWSRLKTFVRGPQSVALAPGSHIFSSSGVGAIGAGGGVSVGGRIYSFNKVGKVSEPFKGFTIKKATSGYVRRRMQEVNRGNFHTNLKDFIIGRAPTKEAIQTGHKRYLLEGYLSGFLNKKQMSKLSRQKKFGKFMDKASVMVDDLYHADTRRMQKDATKWRNRNKVPDMVSRSARPKGLVNPGEFLERKSTRAQVDKFYMDTMFTRKGVDKSIISKGLIRKELESARTAAAYLRYRAQVRLGIGTPFAHHGKGAVQKLSRFIGSRIGAGYKHPMSGRAYDMTASRVIKKGVTAGMSWKNGTTAQFVAVERSGRLLDKAANFFEGTFIMTLEELTGVGVTSRHSFVTKGMAKMFGAKPGTAADRLLSHTIGKPMRVVGAGFAAYHAFKIVGALARETTGWGISDAMGKAYTETRKFQQKVLDDLGVVNAARKTEKLFPGSINSPLARVGRITAPIWGSMLGNTIGGYAGGKLGLALGLALALVTWGDITQSPEELHRIYSGEQDIPIRSGRWWMFGKTPFGGGKISYWRKHWYPMLKSKYKYQGQLWDSEVEEMAQGSPLSPVLAPLLTGKAWDPYYWEKKHYKDRPYVMTGELFEPTMPGASLLNPTVGEFIKPQRMMHPEYIGIPQEVNKNNKHMVSGTAKSLGLEELSPDPMLPNVYPTDVAWSMSELAYTTTEQMGLRGFLLSSINESMTGSKDFLPSGPVAQSARRATGYEREYWDADIGDPGAGMEGGVTEFFRRILPHRRRGVEEYNPIKNEMPDWMPGSEYYKDFKHGDPYTKIKMGEARLPGGGYESLNILHSGIPKVYDAVDRFMILADVAPYSEQYKHYKVLAKGMVKGDSYWEKKVGRKIEQREALHSEFSFLDLNAPEGVEGVEASMSESWRRGLAGLTGKAGAFAAVTPPVPFLMDPIAKTLPYKTAIDTYKDYRIYGSQFTAWNHPGRDFMGPWTSKVAGTMEDISGGEHIPGYESERRDYEEYFDKLKYVKYKRLEELATAKGVYNTAKEFRKIQQKTMTGMNPYNKWGALAAMPKRERAFMSEFIEADQDDRQEILDMVPGQMHDFYKAQWNSADRKNGLPEGYDVARDKSRGVVDFFKTHNLPGSDWLGWHPDVDIRDVQLKVVKQEGMNIHNFDLWESREREMQRRPYVPTIDDIYEPTKEADMSELHNLLYGELDTQGMEDVKVNITQTPARGNSLKLDFNIRRDNSAGYENRIRSMAHA